MSIFMQIQHCQFRRVRALFALSTIFMICLLSSAGFAQAGSANLPTASEAPVAIDQTWQKASAKYDTARTAILGNVDRINGDGPFRPDWESLQTYQIAAWYMDAKSGIFIHGGFYSMPALCSQWCL